jgi:hypothetical protein
MSKEKRKQAGRIIWMDAQVHAELKVIAAHQGVTMQDIVNIAVQSYVSEAREEMLKDLAKEAAASRVVAAAEKIVVQTVTESKEERSEKFNTELERRRRNMIEKFAQFAKFSKKTFADTEAVWEANERKLMKETGW